MSEDNKTTKKPVGVYVYVSPEGDIHPFKIKWYDEQYSVDKIYNILPAASLKAGGFGMRYSCRINEKETHLYQEEEGTWLLTQSGAIFPTRKSMLFNLLSVFIKNSAIRM